MLTAGFASCSMRCACRATNTRGSTRRRLRLKLPRSKIYGRQCWAALSGRIKAPDAVLRDFGGHSDDSGQPCDQPVRGELALAFDDQRLRSFELIQAAQP